MQRRVIRVRSENQAFQHAETLKRNRTKRQRHREFFLEGVRPIDQALKAGWQVSSFLYSRDRRLSGWAEDVLASSQARTYYELSWPLMEKLSGKEESSELIALVAMPDDDLARIPMRPDLLVVVFDRPTSPGNLGTLIRSSDALGAHGLIITGHAADVYAPEAISATTGSLFSLPVVRLASHGDLVPWLEGIGERLGKVQLVGTDEAATVDVASHDYTGPTVLAVGNEKWGLSSAYRELCDLLVRIPMSGAASSMNVSCAASIVLYEVGRQRRARW
ncbi:MAG: RNA methyltransferase [Chloroflexota bacterium]|nr:RNA methyltransferase [Chloroflexota bacterium]